MADKVFIKQKLEELITAGYEVNRISYGKKIVSGSATEEDSFVFGVTRKKPLSDLSDDQIIPSTISSGSVEIKTDVIEVPTISTLESWDFLMPLLNTSNELVTVAVEVVEVSGSLAYKMTAPDGETFTTDQIQAIQDKVMSSPQVSSLSVGEAVTLDVSIASSHCPTCPETIPASSHQSFIRPLQPGTQVSSNDTTGAGTLGFFAVDNDSGALVGVTNLHVTSGTGIKVNQQGQYYAQEFITSKAIFQPVYYYTSNKCGPVVRYKPLDINGANQVDCSLFIVKEGDIDSEQSYKPFGLSWTGSLTFASTAEIDAVVSGSTELYSSGRTTGVKEGVCGLRLSEHSIALSVSGYLDRSANGRRTISFSDVIEFTRIDPTCPYPIAKGDSGSPLLANIGGTWKIIGLCFAGSTYTGYAVRIDNIVSQMNISAWNGESTAFLDGDNPKTFTIDGLQAAESTTFGGKTYYAVGSSLFQGNQNP